MRWLKTGEAPSTVEDIALGAYAETFENIPLIGSAIVAGSTGGFSQGSDPFWAIGNDLGRSLRKIAKGEYEDAAMLAYEGLVDSLLRHADNGPQESNKTGRDRRPKCADRHSQQEQKGQ